MFHNRREIFFCGKFTATTISMHRASQQKKHVDVIQVWYQLSYVMYKKTYIQSTCIYILCFQYRSEEFDESREEDELTPEESSEDDESTIDMNLSEYEIRRKERIAENKKKFQEHFAAITSAKTTKKVLCIYNRVII